MGLGLKIGEVRLAPVDQQFTWSLIDGVRAESRIIEMETARAQQLYALGIGPHTLELIKGEQRKTFRGIYVLAPQPGGSPDTQGVLIADGRWKWRRTKVWLVANARRRSGRRIRQAGRPEVAPVDPDVEFAPWSLDGRRPWTPLRALEDVFQQAKRSIPELEWRLLPSVRPATFEDVAIPGWGLDQAIERILQHMPGYDIHQAADGAFVLRDLYADDGVDVLARASVHVGTGHALKVDHSRLRPGSVAVYFTREIELRFDYDEDRQTQTIQRGREPLILENVLPLPDFSLRVDGRTAIEGEWTKIGDATASVGGFLYGIEQDTVNPRSALAVASKLGPLSQALLRQYYFPGLRTMMTAYSLLANGTPEPVWTRRVQALHAHWRRTFRFLKAWRDKMLSWSPTRVGVVNTELGTRAPAAVYTDWIARPHVKGLITKASQRHDKGWPIAGYADLLVNAKLAPALVTPVSTEEGVFTVEARRDPNGEAEFVVLGSVSNLPSYDLNDLNIISQANTVYALWNQAQLDAGWKMSVVLTCVQGAPNSLDRLHRVVVPSSEITAEPSEGPQWSVVIQPGKMTAMFGWRDEDADQIKESFYTGAQLPDDLLVNADHVRAVARAAASRVYSQFRDRVEGSLSAVMGDYEPQGSMRAATYYVKQGADGVAMGTLLQWPPNLPPLAMETFLPDSVRAVVDRTVQP